MSSRKWSLTQAEVADRIKAIPSRHWEELAASVGVKPWIPRKLVYERERSFAYDAVAPLAFHFLNLDRRGRT